MYFLKSYSLHKRKSMDTSLAGDSSLLTNQILTSVFCAIHLVYEVAVISKHFFSFIRDGFLDKLTLSYNGKFFLIFNKPCLFRSKNWVHLLGKTFPPCRRCSTDWRPIFSSINFFIPMLWITRPYSQKFSWANFKIPMRTEVMTKFCGCYCLLPKR